MHPILGIPFIPASHIKGALRSFVCTEIKLKVSEKAKTNIHPIKQIRHIVKKYHREITEHFGIDINTNEGLSKFYKTVFGSKEEIGHLIFFDAYPTEIDNSQKILFEPDVLSPTYTPRTEYREDRAQPTIIPYLTIARGVVFQFYIAAPKEYKFLVNIATEWLKLALTIQGIGAKTAVGYSYFEVLE